MTDNRIEVEGDMAKISLCMLQAMKGDEHLAAAIACASMCWMRGRGISHARLLAFAKKDGSPFKSLFDDTPTPER